MTGIYAKRNREQAQDSKIFNLLNLI